MNQVSCPSCANECSPLAKSCPKCGHPFQTKNDLQTYRKTEGNEVAVSSGRVDRWKAVTVVVGIIILGMLGYAGFRLYENSNEAGAPSVNANNQAAIPPQIITPAPIPKGVLKIHAAIIYSMGGVQPVARQKFYLLDADLASILRKVSKKKNVKDSDLISTFGMFSEFGGIDPELAEIQKHVKYEVLTDFEGKASFTNVECKKYFLYGLAPTRRNAAVWNIPIDIKEGTSEMVLDQKNAAYSL